ncbi:MAG: hypothetical protein C5S44_05690 [Candidatus Methanocomedens sp.]|nr:MAG: hypothetical protein C5S44_05690 [ANME-2 cluster archaeon]
MVQVGLPIQLHFRKNHVQYVEIYVIQKKSNQQIVHRPHLIGIVIETEYQTKWTTILSPPGGNRWDVYEGIRKGIKYILRDKRAI